MLQGEILCLSLIPAGGRAFLSLQQTPPDQPSHLTQRKQKRTVNRGLGFQEMDGECCGLNRSMGQGKQKLYHWTKPCEGTATRYRPSRHRDFTENYKMTCSHTLPPHQWLQYNGNRWQLRELHATESLSTSCTYRKLRTRR